MATEDKPLLPQIPPLSPEEEAVVLQTDDLQSAEEAKQLSSGKSAGELRRIAQEREAGRTEAFRDHFERLALISLYLVWALLIVFGLVWAYHLVAPPTWFRLPEGQVDHLRSILTGGILAGIASGHVKRRLGD